MVQTVDARAQQIVAEARKRLAASGGKASQLPAMIQRITEQYRNRDDARDHLDNGDQFNMPNNMDNYIDKVLQMSGMVDAPANSGAEFASTPEAGPIPESRDGGGSQYAELPAEMNAPEQRPGMDENGYGIAQTILGALGVAGAGALAKTLYDRYRSRGTADAKGDRVTGGDGGDVDASVRPNVEDAEFTELPPDTSNQVTQEQRTALPPEQRKLTGPSATDEMIDETMAEPNPDRFGGDNLPKQLEVPNPYLGVEGLDEKTARDAFAAHRLAEQGNIDGALEYLTSRGYKINPGAFRTEMANLKSRVGKTISKAARGAVRSVR